ncbi:MAG: amidohydrolase family protein, partial [Victivallales bacterium]|nr:amidohydrolase family protein [Victivallales bacterium]
EMPPEKMIGIMDECGIKSFNNVSANVTLPYNGKEFSIEYMGFDYYRTNYMNRYPGRFYGFTMSDFACAENGVLIKDDDFADKAIAHLEEDLKKGAQGLKITKELGLLFRDYKNEYIPVDDKRLYPVWKKAGELGRPVLIHVSDPVAFFLPCDATNEHYLTLQEFAGWSFYGAHFSKEELLAQRNRMIADHPDTIFICPHVANFAEDLSSVAKFMDENPNVIIDFSARIDELGRQPYVAREFLIKYSKRIIFGTDMIISPEMYRCYFRFLETKDECFEYPDYIGRWGHSRWGIYGLYLPDEVLENIYYKNICALLPELEF